MKKISLFFLMALLSVAANALVYKFYKANHTASVSGSGLLGDIVIPETVKDDDGIVYKVTTIPGMGFAYNNSGLTSITIPNSVISIGEDAFHGCTGLTTAIIGDGAISIGDGAFSSCDKLTNLTIGKSVQTIGASAFRNCTKIESLTIPSSVTSIGEDCFFGACWEATSIKVESGNEYYDSREDCNALIETSTNRLIKGCNNTIIPNTVTSIGNQAFFGCAGLTSITIPSSVISFDENAILYCINVETITVEEGNPIYDSRDNCNGIIQKNNNCLVFGCMNTVIPRSVTSIGELAFHWNYGLTSITIPSNVISIAESAFQGCYNLESVTVEREEPINIDEKTSTCTVEGSYQIAIR